MKFSESDNSSTLFCEQVSTVTSLFEKWNDCERTVVMYALLKRLRYPSLKFLQYSIESNLTQNLCSQINLTTLDINANSSVYLKKLICTYASLPLTNNDDIDYNVYGSDLMLLQTVDGMKNYKRKEDVLKDVLVMLPLLKPGNDEAKAIYLSLTPIAVEDTVRKIVPTELVQQIFSYLLIHPAISSDDRRSLSHWLKHLEDHIQSSYSIAGQRSFYVLSNTTDSSSKSTSVSSVGSVTSRNTWQAIAPPSTIHKQQQSQSVVKAISKPTDWNVTIPRISDSLCDDMQVLKLNEIGSSQNSLGLVYDGPTPSVVNGSRNPNNNNTNINNNNSNDDHHVSFSKNGTEIIDFDSCDNCENMQINNCDHFNMTRWSLDSKISGLKTRRSNSLTTAISSSSSSTSSVVTVNDNCSNSSENLAQYIQKPRSFSLSIENTRTSLASGGSDTRLDDLKPSYLKFQTHNMGMSNIGQWLKSLRLHKYITLFTNMTYDEMLSITEDYLQSLGVTKGASHKLALCIEKLNERYEHLSKIESELINGKITINSVIEELASLVLTPMKPTDSTPRNVATKFLEILDLICVAVYQKDNFSSQDEECVTVILWILERSIHNEAFLVHTNQLKEQKFNLSKLKMSFTPKTHHAKNGSNGSLSKPRWTNKSRKVDAIPKAGSNDRIHRKNSNDISNFSLIASLPQQVSTQVQSSINMQQCSQNHLNNINGSILSGGINCQPYKSSSYPNFSSQQQNHNQQTTNKQHLQQFQQQQHHHSQQPQSQLYRQHRNSLNNLIMVSTSTSQSPQTYKTVNSLLPLQNTTNCTTNTILNNGLECNNRKGSLTSASQLNSIVSGIVKANGASGKVELSLPAAATVSSSAASASSTSSTSASSSSGPMTTTNVAPNATCTKISSVKPLEKTMAAVVLENLAKLDQHFKK